MSDPSQLLTDLLDPQAHGWPAGKTVVHQETHISHVFSGVHQTDKLKKAVDVGFLDYRTLEARKEYCLTELARNQVFSPRLYQSVLPVRLGPLGHRVSEAGTEPIVDYVVRMQTFRAEDRLDHLAEQGALTSKRLDELATLVARVHSEVATPADEPHRYGSLLAIQRIGLQNWQTLADHSKGLVDSATLEELRGGIELGALALEEVFAQRLAQGRIKACHGDLHLGNIALFEGELTLFDCIEFNEDFRQIDVAYDFAFLFMDLLHRGPEGSAWRVLNCYLELTFDWKMPRVIRYLAHFRAIIRAMVGAIRYQQEVAEGRVDQALAREVNSYVALARELLAKPKHPVILMRGPSGSGKSHLGRELAERIGAVQVRSDAVRSNLDIPRQEKYTRETTNLTYETLMGRAHLYQLAGHRVVVDATFGSPKRCELAYERATNAGVELRMIECAAPQDELVRRVKERQGDLSDANERVVREQLATWTELNHPSFAHLQVDTSQPIDWEVLVNFATQTPVTVS